MKPDRTKILIITLAVLALLLLVYLFTANSKSPVNWRQSYDKESRQPYGTYVIYELLKSYFPGKDMYDIEKNLSESVYLKDKQTQQNYFFLGEKLYLNEKDIKAVKDFVKAGNTAFIAAKSIPKNLLYPFDTGKTAKNWYELSYISDTAVTMNLNHPALRSDQGYDFHYKVKDRYIADHWHFLERDFESFNEDYVELGRLNQEKINFLMVKFGDGRFVFHSNPLVLTNYHLKRARALEYAEALLTHMKQGKIYWDNYNNVKHIQRNNKQSPLSFILSQPSLRWAWYLGLLLLFLYLIFRSKRKQRIIPVMSSPRNSSLEFVKTVGRLYFQQNDHKKLAEQKFRLFLNDIRKKYQLNIKNDDALFFKQLSAKSGVNMHLIENIFQQYEYFKNEKQILKTELLEFHNLLEDFYRKSK